MITIDGFTAAAMTFPLDAKLVVEEGSDGVHSIVVSDGSDVEKNREILQNITTVLREKYGQGFWLPSSIEEPARVGGLTSEMLGAALRNARLRGQLMRQENQNVNPDTLVRRYTGTRPGSSSND